MPDRQRKNEKATTQRSKINRTKAENASKKISKKAANRSKPQKRLQTGMPKSYSRDYSNTYRDLRSASVPRKRERARKYKYYNFSVVNAGQLNVPHYQTEPYHSIQGWPNPQPVDLSDLPIVPMTKKSLYQEAQRTAPIIRHKHHCCTWKTDKYSVKNAQRHEIEAREIAKGLNSQGKCWDYSGLGAQCLDDYVKEKLWRVWDDYEQGGDTLKSWGYDTEASFGCLCDNCVWARHGWISPEGEEECYEGVGTKMPEDEEAEEWAGWFETLFDQGSQLIDAAMEKRSVLVQKEMVGLGWVDAVADQEEVSDMDVDTAVWFGLWDSDWIDWSSVAKTESESSFEMV